MGLEEQETNNKDRGTMTPSRMDLLEIAECSPDSPVKKDLVRMRGSNIVLVCLEAGHEIPPHPEPYAVVFVVLEGEGTITSGSVRYSVKPLDLVSIGKDQDRGIRCSQRMGIPGIRDETCRESPDA